MLKAVVAVIRYCRVSRRYHERALILMLLRWVSYNQLEWYRGSVKLSSLVLKQ